MAPLGKVLKQQERENRPDYTYNEKTPEEIMGFRYNFLSISFCAVGDTFLQSLATAYDILNSSKRNGAS